MELFDSLLLGILIVILASVLAGLSETRRSSRSLSFFYTSGGETSRGKLSHLIMASSMSLNGLFYHTWLGYKVGVYSFVVQAFWAASFIWLIYNRQRLLQISKRHSLFGAIRASFGQRTARICIVASCFSLTVLVGWEASIAGALATDLGSLDFEASIIAVLVLVVATALYTYRGGMLANARANSVQNVMKFICFSAIAIGSLFLLFSDHNAFNTAGYNVSADYSIVKYNIRDATIGVFGISALLCNLFFSLMWQPADPTAWQYVSSASNGGARNEEELKKALTNGALLVLIFPGLAGTLFGMSLSSVADLTDQSIMSSFFNILYVMPYGWALVLALGALLAASMLSTMDGLLLGISYTINRDFLYNNEMEKLYTTKNIASDYRPSDIEKKRIILGKALVLGAAIVSIGVFLAIRNEYIGLFETVYLAVIGQMAISPLALKILLGREKESESPAINKLNWICVSLGLLAGASCVALHFYKFNDGMVFVSNTPEIGGLPWLIMAPPLTFAVTWITLQSRHKFS